jgi:hypothetical protein
MVSEKAAGVDNNASTDDIQQGDVVHHVDAEASKSHGRQFDAAIEYFDAHAHEFIDITEDEQRKVLWKIDLRLMPIMLVTITLAAVDVSSKPASSKLTYFSLTTGRKLLSQTQHYMACRRILD